MFIAELWISFLISLQFAWWSFLRSPRASYETARRWRDWVLAKVEYLQSESQKWKALFTTLKLPYSALRMMGVSPNMAVSMLVAGSAVGGGVVVAEVMEPPSFSRGDSGVYSAPLDIPVFYEEGNNTLRLDLGSTPVGLIEIDSVTVGTAYANSALPANEVNAVILTGLPTTTEPAFTGNYIEIGHLIIDRWRCTQLTLDEVEAHTLNIKYNASDGQSIAPMAGTPRQRAIGGGNRADAMVTSGGYYDQIKITSSISGVSSQVDVMKLSNLYTKGGPCDLKRLKLGTLDLVYNETGAGDGFAAKDFIIGTSVTYKVFNNVDNVEVSISPPS